MNQYDLHYVDDALKHHGVNDRLSKIARIIMTLEPRYTLYETSHKCHVTGDFPEAFNELMGHYPTRYSYTPRGTLLIELPVDVTPSELDAIVGILK